MNYHQYYSVDVINGPGTRCTLFVAGCVHACPHCYNKNTWRTNSGLPFTEEMADKIIIDLQDSRIKRQGLSLTGGDPLHPDNISAVLQLIRRVRRECPDKDIWLWSGYQREDLSAEQQQVIDLVDVLIDGTFIQERADPTLLWRGSSNQRIHYLR